MSSGEESKACSACGARKEAACFSKTQWRAKAYSRKCLVCAAAVCGPPVPLVPGDRVRLHSLASAAHNNKLGVVENFIFASGRWEVKLDSAHSLSVRPQNLTRVTAGTAAPGLQAGAAPRQAAGDVVGLTAQQLATRLNELQAAGDWRGLVALEKVALELSRHMRGTDPRMAGAILHVFGQGFNGLGDYGRARELEEQRKAMAEERGDRAEVATACTNLGNNYLSTGDLKRASELHKQRKAISEALGDRAGVATACGNLGNCYSLAGDYGRAREMLEEHKAVAEAMGDRKGAAAACANLGSLYQSMGDHGRAREMHEQHKAMAEALGHRAGVAGALGNLGNCYQSTGDYGRACALYKQSNAIFEELGDCEGMSKSCFNLGKCYLSTDEYGQAVSFFTEQYNLAKRLQIGKDMTDAALGIGVALRLKVRDNLRGRAAGASQLPGLDSSALACRDDACRDDACRDDAVREAEKWLQTARDDGGLAAARLHLAHLAFATGREDTALAHLQGYVSWCVGRGRNLCAGCEQTRDEDAQMLTCGGCRVARFCNADHQKMASKSVASGGGLLHGRHRDLCGVLGKWRRQVVKDGMSPDSCRADLLAFLQQLSEDLRP